MQKRNFYRAGWLRFDDNADMGAVMSELSDTKAGVHLPVFKHILIMLVD